jgi:hypothetical protein
MAQYPNLPGIEVQIADGGLILPEDTSTQSLLIIAPSLVVDAPTEPVLVRQSSDLDTMGFGTFVIGGVVNPIAAAWKAAFEGGCRRIYLMALTGADDATKFLNVQDAMFGILADFTVDHVALVGVYADKEVTLASMPATSEGVKQVYSVTGASVLTFPITVTLGTNDTIKIGTQTMTLKAGSYATQDLYLAEVQAEIDAAGIDMTAQIVGGKLVLSQDVAFSTATGTNAGTLAAGAAVQKITGNYALLAGQFAESQTLNHNATIAYVGTSAPAGNTLAQVKTQVDLLTGISNEYSGYVSVVAMPELGYLLPGKSDIYYTNGVVTYAALVSTLRAESAPTNKRVYGVAGIRYNLSLRQLNSLTGNKFVTFRLKGNQIVVTDGCTTAPDYVLGGLKQSSDFARLSTLRITQAATQLIRDLTEPFIGEPNRMPQYNSFNATIKAGLESMKNQGAIMDYRFTVTATGGTLSEATVTLQLIPAFELKRITVNVALKPPYSLN